MPEETRHPYTAGTQVQVRNRFNRSWSSGFEVADEQTEDDVRTYRLRRRSDRSVLPASFPFFELRRDREKA